MMVLKNQINENDILDNLKKNFPSFIPPYWLKKSVDYYSVYLSALGLNDYYKRQKGEIPEYVNTLERIIVELEELQKNRFGYRFVIDYLSKRLMQERWFSAQYQNIHSNLKINQIANRSKAGYPMETFYANLYLGIFSKYWENKERFPKTAFIRFAYEIMYYFELIDDICYEQLDDNGKIKVTRFIWLERKKTFFNTESYKNIDDKLFECDHFDRYRHTCGRLANRNISQRLCERKDCSQLEPDYNFLHAKLKEIIKKLKKNPDHYELDYNNALFWHRYLSQSPNQT